MSVTSVEKDPEALTLTIETEHAAPIERVWELWQDPHLLEQWWGPPAYPATMVEHDLTPGGRVRYYMTGPEDVKHYGWWRIESIDEPHRIEFTNGLAGDDGEPVPGVQPMGGVVTFERIGSATRMTVLTQFVDTEQMEKMIEGSMEQGMSQAIGQIDALLELVHAA